MANALINATGAADAYTKIVAALVATTGGGFGLTQVDDIPSGGGFDRVFDLPGESGSGHFPLKLRLTLGKEERAPGSAILPSQAEGVVSRLYATWDPVTHTGKNATGRVGRRFILQSKASSGRYGHYLPTKRTPVLGPDSHDTRMAANQATQWEFDGRNILTHHNGNQILEDYQNSTMNFLGGRPDGRDMMQSFCTIINPTTGKQETFYFVRQDQQVTNFCFAKYDWGNQSYYPLADPLWAPGGGVGYYVTGWDGNDRLYVIRMYQAGSNDFAYYTFSTNTWTSLPNFVCTNANFDYDYIKGGQNLRHVPASMSGYSEDCFYYLCPNWAAETTWFRYKVTTGAWETSGATGFPALPLPKYQYGHQCLIVDSEAGANGSLYYSASDNFQYNVRLWRWDLASPNAWQAEDTNFNACNNATPWGSDNSGTVMLPVHHQAGKLQLPLANSNLVIQMVGNKDFVAMMATWVPPNNVQIGMGQTLTGPSYQIQRTSYAGNVNPVKRTKLMVVASAISPGINVTITLQASAAGEVFQGEILKLVNMDFNGQADYHGGTWTPGGGELVEVVSITDATHVVVGRVTGTYNAPTDRVYLTQDGINAVVGNDGGMYVRLRSGTGAYQPDGEADVLFAAPTLPPALTSVGADGIGQISGLSLYQKWTGSNYGGGQGELLGLFVAHASANINETFYIDGHPYTVYQAFLGNLAPDRRLNMIGGLDA